jgi:hypothetical protein
MTRLQGYNGRPRPAVPSQIDKSLERALKTLTGMTEGQQ